MFCSAFLPHDYKPDIILLQETKLSSCLPDKARSFLPSTCQTFHAIGAYGSRGGILMAWNDSLFSKVSFVAIHYSLSISFTSTLSDLSFTFSNIYAPSDTESKTREESELCSNSCSQA